MIDRTEEVRQHEAAALETKVRTEEKITALSKAMSEIILDPDQPRTVFDEASLADLADNIAALGQLLPISVRWDAALKKWVIVDGHRRYLAKQRLGHANINAVEDESGHDATMRGFAQLSANHFRDDMSVGDVARKLVELKDQGMTSAQLAAAGWKGPRVTQTTAYLALEPDIQALVDDGKIVKSAIYPLSLVPTTEARRAMAAELAAGRMTKDQAVAKAKAARGGARHYNREPKGESESGKDEMIVLKHPSGITFRFEKKRGNKTIKAALAWAIRQLAEEPPAQPPTGDAQAEPDDDGSIQEDAA